MADRVYTRCNDCIFAQFTDGKQTGCDVGRLDEFQKTEGLVEWNAPTESYIINRVCNMKRLEKWANRQDGDKIEAAYKEISVGVDFVLIVENNSTYKEAAAGTCRTLKSLAQQTMAPISIVIVNSNAEVDKNMQEFWNMIVETLTANCGDKRIKYRLVRLMAFNREIGRMIDEGLAKCSAQYYAVVSTGQCIALDTVQRINDMMNKLMYRFLIIEPTHVTANYPTVIQRVIHDMLGGNLDEDAATKVKRKIQEQNKPEMARLWER